MTNVRKHDIPEGSRPSEEEEFYVAWGRETLKNNLVFANQVLRQLVTLSATLLGGSIAFLDASLIDVLFKRGVILLFFFSLIASFVGIMPYQGSVDLQVPAEVKQYKTVALKWKRYCLWVSGGFLALGFILALVGIIVHQP